MRHRPTIARDGARQRTYRPLQRSIVSVIALAGLNVLAILTSIEPAAAGFLSSVQSTAKKAETCQDKHAGCTRRCIDTYDTGGESGRAAAFRCVSRTCDKQHDNCVKQTGNTSGGGDKLSLPPRDTSPHPYQIPSGGILSTLPGLPSRGPAATGSPVGGAPAAPSAPPVIIR
jgi:hypothetical protein